MSDGKMESPHPPFRPTPEQSAVIDAEPDARLLVVAGPGTGKTQVAAMRLVHLLRAGLQPSQILVLSFSRSAVATLTARIAALDLRDESIVEDLRHLAIRTFDSWAFRLLRQAGASVSELLANSHDTNIELATQQLAGGHASQALDRLSAIRHVIVDEFQDLPGVRADMVIELLAALTVEPQRRVGFTVLGDPAQSIFQFSVTQESHTARMRDPWDVLKERLGKDLRQISMIRNHRSTEELARIAAALREILQSSNVDPMRKLEAVRGYLDRLPSKDPETKIGPELLDSLPQGSLAVLTRTNGEALMVAKMIYGTTVESPSIPVLLRIVGTTRTAPAWIGQLLSRFKPSSISRSTFDSIYANALKSSGDGAAGATQMPARDVAWQRLARASGGSDDSSSIDVDALRERLGWPDAFPDDQGIEQPTICITTIHQAKGMEFRNVALLEPRPREDTDEPDDPIEEANVGFVAVTRASHQLGRIPASCINRAPSKWSFSSRRDRLVGWGTLTKVQMGLQDDILPESFVDTDVHGSIQAVEAAQMALLLNAAGWRGRKVILKRADSAAGSGRYRDIRYDIHLQSGNEAGQLLGRMSANVTWDLLDLLWDRGLAMPSTIYNLRIADVVTLGKSGDLEGAVADPWSTSRIWLGVSLWGTGDFKTWKRKHG
ncbi:UvrD-helicase domain-containing protein [Piscinibacterium candidicorallinum]|uniref:DNA 3'-5' helicase II n=1 Tax=Piscinibacterium candidicorallinum TaxID=1793872 RepID=A0ABV7H460_9BURK